jgi:YidC/Oxa1 family membrane protein insertase
MERSNILKWLLIALALLLFVTYGREAIFGKAEQAQQPNLVTDVTAPSDRSPEDSCTIEGEGFVAELSSRGGALRHFRLTRDKYFDTTAAEKGQREPVDLVTTSLEPRLPLRTRLRLPGEGAQQVAYDDLDWTLAPKDGKACVFKHEDKGQGVELTKVVSATERPYELSVELTVKNAASEPRKHRLSFELSSWRTQEETQGGFFKPMPEWHTEVVAATGAKLERYTAAEFEPGDFKDEQFTAEHWRRPPGDARFVAVSSSYFTQLAIPQEGPAAPNAEALVEEPSPLWPSGHGAYWKKLADARRPIQKDPSYGHIYRARLAYPELELAPQGTATYKVLTYTGPKERDLLAALAHGTSEVINLGWFSPIAKVLISYLYVLYRTVGSWGWAIVLLTITVRILLFPLSLQQIKSAAAMRKLKPEMDALNERYKDDPTQRAVALQELWRKNKVANPLVGCFPVLLQMPVWFALYTALQTAVELYHTPFGPLIRDLASRDPYFVIPVVLGGSSFFQQKLMPPQGDPAQQKMMLYMLPAIFTAMMLFLPAGLGVYMLTNTWLGIGQQVLVERWLKARDQGGIEVREKESGGDAKSAPALGKGKARVRG